MPTEVYEHVVTGYLAGQFCQTVIHTSVNNSGSTPPFAVADQINDHMAGAGNFLELFANCLPQDYRFSSIRTRRVGPTGGPTAIKLAGDFTTDLGQRAGEISSQQISPLIIWIPTTAPAKTGRTFIPGVSEDDITTGVLDTTLLAAITLLCIEFTTSQSITAGTYEGCIFRRATKAGDLISFYYTSPLIGTQRRRLHPV